MQKSIKGNYFSKILLLRIIFSYICETMKNMKQTSHARACAKINLGLNVVRKRSDGYHDIETIFYPIPLYDELTILPAEGDAPHCQLIIEGLPIDCDTKDNLICKAYNVLAENFNLPPIVAKLQKTIPMQAGMGGGSSDAATMLCLLNNHFSLNLSDNQLENFAKTLGADCPFFITKNPSFATGIGEVLTPVPNLHERLKGKHILIVKPPYHVSTKEAYSLITPREPEISCDEAILQPIESWKNLLTNDFEKSVFAKFPRMQQLKDTLYQLGATFALMSGSGSALFGIYETEPVDYQSAFPDCQVFLRTL